MSKGAVDNKTLYNARIAAQPEFYPGFTKTDASGKPVEVSHRLVARLYVNPVGRKNENGQREELPPMKYTVTAWGEAAINWARNASIGKTLKRVVLKENQYQSKVYNGDQPVIGQDGQPLMQTRSSYTVMEWFWGDDSAKIVAEDIRKGHRYYGWDGKLDVALLEQVLAQGGDAAVRDIIARAKQAQEAWKQVRQARENVQYQPGSATFGWAIVKSTTSAGAQPGQQPAYNQPAPVYNQPPHNNPAPTYSQPAQNAGAAPVYAPPVQDANRGVVYPGQGNPNAEQHNYGGTSTPPAASSLF